MATDRTEREIEDDVAASLREWLARHDYVVADPDSVGYAWLIDVLDEIDTDENPHDGRTQAGRAWREAIDHVRQRVVAHRDSAQVALIETPDAAQ